MKNTFCIFILILFYIQCLEAGNIELPKDTVSIERVIFDSIIYEEFRTQKKFNYYTRQPDGLNMLQQLYNSFYKWINNHLDPNLNEMQFNKILIVALIIVLLLIGFLLYIYKPSLFYINRKYKLNYQMNNETIEKTDFNRLIQEAINREEYPEAIRWNYLMLLKELNNKGLITFNSNKTVNEYINEFKQVNLKTDFKILSQKFIYYRYGNGTVTEKAFSQFQKLSASINSKT